MKRKHYSVEQIVAILKQAEVGVPVAEPIRQAGISEQSFIAGRNSMLDIRHTFPPLFPTTSQAPALLKRIFGSWSTHSIIYALSAPPVNVVTGKNSTRVYSFGG